MRKWMQKFNKNESGNALILMAISMMSLLCVSGLAIDGGIVYMEKSHLQKTANAAVLSGAQELTNEEKAVKKIVDEVLSMHKEPASKKAITISMNKKVSLELAKTVKLSFSSIFGFDSMRVEAKASADIGAMGKAVGAVPLGIDESIPLEYFKTYELKTDSHGVQYGNFGVLALGGPGASTYEENFRKGYQSEIKVGDIIDTQTGNIAGKTRAVVQERINGCLEMPRDFNDRDCSRIILVPVYQPYNHQANQMKSIKVTGFAYFYITDPMGKNDTAIKGMFIKRTGTGFQEPGSVDRGAYSIRLTE